MRFIDEIIEFVTKNAVLIFSIMVGAILKVAIDIKRKEHLSWWERGINLIISVCVGWIAWRMLKAFDKIDYTGFVVPMATLFGETIAMWIIMNANSIMNRFFDKYLPNKK